MGKKTSELTGHALNFVVSQIEGVDHDTAILNITVGDDNGWKLDYLTWAQGGPIIEREGIAIDCLRLAGIIDGWVAALPSPTTWEDEEFVEEYCGTTPLIAAMRCYVASKLGDEVEIPEELK